MRLSQANIQGFLGGALLGLCAVGVVVLIGGATRRVRTARSLRAEGGRAHAIGHGYPAPAIRDPVPGVVMAGLDAELPLSASQGRLESERVEAAPRSQRW